MSCEEGLKGANCGVVYAVGPQLTQLSPIDFYPAERRMTPSFSLVPYGKGDNRRRVTEMRD